MKRSQRETLELIGIIVGILAGIATIIGLVKAFYPTTPSQIPSSTTPIAFSTPAQSTRANPSPVATPSPTPTSTPQDLYNQITMGTPTFTDSLSNQDNYNWSVDTECSFSSDGYRVHVPSTFFAWCIEQNIDFSNFLYQARITIVKGDSGGILFREDYTNGIFYYFYIGQDGSYNLFVYEGIKGQQGTLLQTGHSSVINIGTNQSNLLAVLAKGSNLYLFINKQFVFSVIDSTLNSGLIGIIALPKNNPTAVVCNEIQLWKL